MSEAQYTYLLWWNICHDHFLRRKPQSANLTFPSSKFRISLGFLRFMQIKSQNPLEYAEDAFSDAL